MSTDTPPPIDAAAEARVAAMMTDEFLLLAFQRTDGEPDNVEVDALLAEIERRGLDI